MPGQRVFWLRAQELSAEQQLSCSVVDRSVRWVSLVCRMGTWAVEVLGSCLGPWHVAVVVAVGVHAFQVVGREGLEDLAVEDEA